MGGDIANYRLYSRTGIVNGALSFNSYYNGSAWVHDDNTKVSMNMYMSDSRDNLEFAVRDGGASDGFGTTHLAIGGDGRVGIGTTSPAVTTHIHSDDETNVYITTDADNRDTGLWFGHDIDGTAAYTGIVYDRSEFKLKLFNANSIANHLVIGNNGEVGIGTNDFTNMGSSSYKGLKVGGATLTRS